MDPKKQQPLNTTSQPLNNRVSGSPGIGKEKEIGRTGESVISELGQEQELTPEVAKAGVVIKPEQIEVPPDLTQLGVKQTGFSTPVSYQPTLKLPIADDEIVEGRHANIFSSLRWLSEWCTLVLKRFHLTLKVIRGKVTRVPRK